MDSIYTLLRIPITFQKVCHTAEVKFHDQVLETKQI